MEIEQEENVTVGMNNMSFDENNGKLICINFFAKKNLNSYIFMHANDTMVALMCAVMKILPNTHA